MIIISEDKSEKVGFDARQRFYEELMERLARTAEFTDRGDLRSWCLELHGMYNMVAPWISKADRKLLENGGDGLTMGLWELREKVNAAAAFDVGSSAWMGTAAGIQGLKIEKDLLKIGGKLMMASKHMMLPGKDDDDETNAMYR